MTVLGYLASEIGSGDTIVRGLLRCAFALSIGVAEASAAQWRARIPSPPSGFVYVRATAWLRTGPSADADRVRVVVPATGSRVASDAVLPFRAKGWVGEFLEVETLGVSTFCGAPRLSSLVGYKLRFLVREQDVALATSRDVEISFNDGTTLSLRPGVPLMALDESDPAGPFSVSFLDPLPRIRIPPTSVSRVFYPRDRDRSVAGPRIAAQVWLDGAERTIRGGIAADPAADAGDGFTSATVEAPCAQATVRVSSDLARQFPAPITLADKGAVVSGREDEPYGEGMTTVFWLDGRVAGWRAQDDVVRGWSRRRPEDCYDIPLDVEGTDDALAPLAERTLTVCLTAGPTVGPAGRPGRTLKGRESTH